MNFSRAVVTIKGIAPYSQSHKHDDPKLDGEQPDAYDLRTWRSKMNVEEIKGKKTVVIPAFGFHLSLVSAARYSKKKIVGQRNATWTAKIQAGVAMVSSGIMNVDPADVNCVVLSLNADGKRGSGARVTRRIPQIPMGWEATFEIMILDPIINEEIFREMLDLAGLFVGVGQFRPENGGSNGRFSVKSLKWEDNRQAMAA